MNDRDEAITEEATVSSLTDYSVTPANPPLRRARRKSHGANDRSPATILVVEDSPGTLAFLTLMLESSGYNVVPARDGLEALHKFEQRRPDLVILDLELPTVSGFRLIRLFRPDNCLTRIPVIVVTALDYDEAEEVAQAGATDLITKPFEADDLLSRVAFALKRSKSGTWLPGTVPSLV